MNHQEPCVASSTQAPLPRAFTEFETWPDDAFVQIAVVCLLLDCSRATAWRRVKKGIIPAPLKISEGCAVWRVGDLRRALAALTEGGAPVKPAENRSAGRVAKARQVSPLAAGGAHQ